MAVKTNTDVPLLSAPWTKSLLSVPSITQHDVDTWADKIAKIPLKKQTKGYSNWIEGYIQDVEVKTRPKMDGVTVRCKSYPSMKKKIDLYSLEVTISNGEADSGPVFSSLSCHCKAGNGHCSHMIGLLYTLCHFKKKGFKSVPPVVSKTSLPQTWNVPTREAGIAPQRVDSMTVTKVKPSAAAQTPLASRKRKRRVAESVVPNIYCPVKRPIPSQEFGSDLQRGLKATGSDAQMLKLLPWLQENAPTNIPETNTKYGPVPKGSVLSYQQRLQENLDDIITHHDVRSFPPFPLPPQPSTYGAMLTQGQQEYYSGLDISRQTAEDTEKATRDQSLSKTWKDLRSLRLTSSKFHQIVIRRNNHGTLAARLMKVSHVQTKAMREGLENEPKAAKEYANLTGSSVFKCGFVINPSAPHLGTSPDRVVYDPSNPAAHFGLLEIKCPSVDSYTDCKYLKSSENGYKLKRNHDYYHQVVGQMGLTGLTWCDFVVLARNDFHLERIEFVEGTWADMKQKLDMFYFEHYLILVCQKKTQ